MWLVSFTEYERTWSSVTKGKTLRTDSTIVETGSQEDQSPNGSNRTKSSFSELVDSDEANRESLDDDFERLVADASITSTTNIVSFTDASFSESYTENSSSHVLTRHPSTLNHPLSESGRIYKL